VHYITITTYSKNLLLGYILTTARIMVFLLKKNNIDF